MTGKQKTVIDNTMSVAELFASVNKTEVMQRLLEEILTPAELRDMSLRWQLLERLYAGESQRKIAEDLRVSLCKITRGSRILKQPDAVTVSILKKRLSKRK